MEDLTEGDHLEGEGGNGKMWNWAFKKVGWEGVEWIDLAEDGDK